MDSPAGPSAGFMLFDFDNHYYEARDAFTRYAPREFGTRGVEWVQVRGRDRILVGGKLNSYVVRPDFDPVSRPGALYHWYRGNPQHQSIREAFGELEPIRPEYQDRDARLSVMDQQGLQGAMLFPTLGVGLEAALADDPEAAHEVFHAFNRWLQDDWGFSYRQRIFGVPYVALLDPIRAVAELEWAVEQGARAVNIRNAPVPVPGGYRSPADGVFDRFWGIAEETGILVTTHAGLDGYDALVHMWEPGEEHSVFRSPLRHVLLKGRAVADFYGALVCHLLFERFPRLRMVSVENGASWVPDLLHRLSDAAARNPGYFSEDPAESLLDHLWLTPFWEDDVHELSQSLPLDHIVLGSDWPHAEGTVTPAAFADEALGWADDQTRRMIMRSNGLQLVGLS